MFGIPHSQCELRPNQRKHRRGHTALHMGQARKEEGRHMVVGGRKPFWFVVRKKTNKRRKKEIQFIKMKNIMKSMIWITLILLLHFGLD